MAYRCVASKRDKSIRVSKAGRGLEDEPKIVNGLLTRLFRGIKIMGDGSVVPVLRN